MKCYKSRWILTSTGEVLENFALVVDEGKITDIIPQTDVDLAPEYIKDFGNSVITPGFVDLFTQYQYTNVGKIKPKSFKYKLKKFFITLSMKFNFAGISKDNYCYKWAQILTDYFSMTRDEKLESFADGIEASIAAGTTCIAQVSREYKFFDIINRLPIKTYLFFEIYADSSMKSKKTFKYMRSVVEDLIYHKGPNTYIGIMLNSISGVHRKLWELFSKYCRKHNMLMMTRFIESVDEIEWLEHGFSDIDILHKFIGFRKISPFDRELSPVEYLEKMKVPSNKVIIANANMATDKDLQKLSDDNVKFVYQPLYNQEMNGEDLGFEKVLKYFDTRFGISTQSFSPDKDFNLLKLVLKLNEEIQMDIVELLKYITIYPAKILRLDHITGSIEKGKDADFNVFKLDEGEDYKALNHHFEPYSTYSQGSKLVKKGNKRFDL